MSVRPLHVLFVARWYPSHDQPARGTFVADLAAALVSTGRADVTIASFDPAHVRGVADTRAERSRQANAVLDSVLGEPAALNGPVSWGVRRLPVARLPVLLDGDRRRPTDIVVAHAIPLVAFATAVHGRRPIDIIHAHTGLPDGVAALRVAEELDLPLIVTEHASTTADELVDAEARELYRRLVAPPRRVVAVSRSLAHDLARALGISEGSVAVVPNAVPVDAFPTGGWEDREPTELLYVGARKPSKGIETLMRAFADVQGRRPDLRLRLIGSAGQPADETRWQALTAELGLTDAVAFEPPASRDGVAAAMRRAAVFVHPSPHETFGMVAAEALASGLPVAATPSGGVDEIVGRDGRFGAIATSISAPSLVDAIDRTLAAAPRVDRAAMRTHVEANYAAPAVARRALDAYQDVILKTARRPRDILAQAAGAEEARGSGGRPRASAFRFPLVLGLARGQAIERVGLLPEALRDRLTMITIPRGRYADDRDLPAWGDWLELDQEQFYRNALAAIEKSAQPSGGLGRLKAALTGPNLDRLRKDLAGRRDAVRREGVARFFQAAAARLPMASDDPALIVALDADDLILASQLPEWVGRVAPGGLRWLADAWDAAGRPG